MAYDRKETYTIQYVLERLHGEELVDFDGDMIDMTSLRYLTFEKGVVCVKCGLVGSYFAKERTHSNKGYHKYNKWHLNLYAINGKGEEVLMTKDHIIPSSLGGKDDLDNLQTMCMPCNSKKGNKLPEGYTLKELEDGKKIAVPILIEAVA